MSIKNTYNGKGLSVAEDLVELEKEEAAKVTKKQEKQDRQRQRERDAQKQVLVDEQLRVEAKALIVKAQGDERLARKALRVKHLVALLRGVGRTNASLHTVGLGVWVWVCRGRVVWSVVTYYTPH